MYLQVCRYKEFLTRKHWIAVIFFLLISLDPHLDTGPPECMRTRGLVLTMFSGLQGKYNDFLLKPTAVVRD